MKFYTIVCLGLILFAITFCGCSKTYDLNAVDLFEDYTSKNKGLYDAFINANAPSEDAFIAVLRMAEGPLRSNNKEEAVSIFRGYRKLFKPMDTRFEKIIALIEKDEEKLIGVNLGEGINTKFSEIKPTPSADGKKLYFSTDNTSESYGGKDIFVSEFKDGKWQKAVNLGAHINTKKDETINAITADGNSIILFGNYKNSFGRGDLFYADKTLGGWGGIEHFDSPINGFYNDCNGFITSDGKAILFTSDRPGNIGEKHLKDEKFHGDYWGNFDIYVCVKNNKGWSEPINLGPTINTPYCEYTPFLHPDGKTLYFSSDGHYGLGRLDIFKSERLDKNSWTKWSEPVNLGKGINSPDQEWGYKIATAGDFAYYSASKPNEGFGKNDIYKVKIPEEVMPEIVATITGTIIDSDNNPIEAKIIWEDLSTSENIGELLTNPEKGEYFIPLPLGKNYGIYAEKKGYYPASINIDLKDEKKAITIVKNLVLRSIEEIKEHQLSIKITNIFFETGKAKLKQESYPALGRLSNILKENPDLKVEISGHTDSIGSHAYNLKLSQKRAQAVVDYLIFTGCNAANLISKGYAFDKPVADNATVDGRAKNRRVEFTFIK